MENLIIHAGAICELYQIQPTSLVKLVKPLETEMRELGNFDAEHPTFNKQQLDLLFRRLGKPHDDDINKMLVKEALKNDQTP